MEPVDISPYRETNLAKVADLESRVQPYRPEDVAEVQAMFTRARQAELAYDERWMGFDQTAAQTLPSPADLILGEFDAFWVAEWTKNRPLGLVGMVGVQTFRPGDVIAPHHPLVRGWQAGERVAELRRLRVAPEARRQGLGTRLCQIVIDWARRQGYGLLVVNTTTPQLPAQQLYRKLGFGRSVFPTSTNTS